MEGCPKTLKPSHRAKRETGGGKGHPVKLRVRFSFWWFFFVFCFYCSIAQLCLILVTPWTAACQASLSITNFQSLLKLMFIESIVPSNRLILHGPLLLPSVFPSIRVFSSESALHIGWYLWLHWVFVAACGFPLVAAGGIYLSCGAWVFRCGGFSCCGAWALST